ncbi:MAG: S-methyl-5-thioribose-1-phosphate isomerase, partial [Anaerolineales bacterium]
MDKFYTIRWIEPGVVSMIDQRKLPHNTVYNEYSDPTAVADAIKDMVIRGAPAIGAAAAFGLTLVPWHAKSGDLELVIEQIHQAAEILRASR